MHHYSVFELPLSKSQFFRIYETAYFADPEKSLKSDSNNLSITKLELIKFWIPVIFYKTENFCS